MNSLFRNHAYLKYKIRADVVVERVKPLHAGLATMLVCRFKSVELPVYVLGTQADGPSVWALVIYESPGLCPCSVLAVGK